MAATDNLPGAIYNRVNLELESVNTELTHAVWREACGIAAQEADQNKFTSHSEYKARVVSAAREVLGRNLYQDKPGFRARDCSVARRWFERRGVVA